MYDWLTAFVKDITETAQDTSIGSDRIERVINGQFSMLVLAIEDAMKVMDEDHPAWDILNTALDLLPDNAHDEAAAWLFGEDEDDLTPSDTIEIVRAERPANS